MANLVSSPCTTSILCGCLAFAFPAAPHFNNRYLRVTCSTLRTSTAASAAPSTHSISKTKTRQRKTRDFLPIILLHTQHIYYSHEPRRHCIMSKGREAEVGGFETLNWKLLLGIFLLGTFASELSFGILRLGTFAL